MKKILRAVAAAMLLATGAQAATVEFPTDGSNVYTFRTGDTAYAPGDLYNIFRLTLTISDTNSPAETRRFVESGDPAGFVFPFAWSFAPDEPQQFFISAVLESYANARIVISGNQGGAGSSQGPITYNLITSPESLMRREEFPRFMAERAAVTPPPTPMPIAGSLPLLLSALGLGALVMRRRAQRAALA